MTRGDYVRGAEEAFERFVALANKYDLHPNDWSRFYAWVGALHWRSRARLSGAHVKRLLLDRGFHESQASEAGMAFYHLQGFIKADPRR